MQDIFRKENYDPGIVQELGRIDLMARVIASGLQMGAHKSLRHGFSTEFSEYKSYQTSDDPRLIDWLLFARTDKLYVKRYEAETDVEVRMLLDASASMSWSYEGKISKLEYAVNLLAALSQMHIAQMNKVGLFLQGRGDIVFHPPRCQRKQLEMIFASLASVEAGGANCFEELCSAYEKQKRHRGMTIVFSDLEEDPEVVANSLERLGAYQDDVILVHILDKAEIDLPFEDATHLEDAETGELIKIDDSFKNDHRSQIAAFRQRMKDLCIARRIAYVPLDTSTNYFDSMMQFIGKTREFLTT